MLELIKITHAFLMYRNCQDAQFGDIVIHQEHGIGSVRGIIESNVIVVAFDNDAPSDDGDIMITHAVKFDTLGLIRVVA